MQPAVQNRGGLWQDASICAKGGDAIFIQTDCSKASAIKELVDKTVTHYGKLDGVVSNAGIGMGGTPLHEYGEGLREDLLPEQRGRLCRDEVRRQGHPQEPQRGGFLNKCGIGGGSCAPAWTGAVQCRSSAWSA